ncbi:MAG: 6-phosphogluconolactonase [Planctomycetes bacterium]|nr:6-phosphogluconolactonase [Planctomycetota bacterium]
MPAGTRTSLVANAAAAVPLLLAAMHDCLARGGRPVVGFATGATFAPFLGALAAEFVAGRVRPDAFVATHLDEYEGFPPDRRGGMVHELFAACPALRTMHEHGAFWPVPAVADAAAIAAHERRLGAAGGVALQFVGIGRNGHVAFHEPGVPLSTGFHEARLAAPTRDDARSRFAPEEPPLRAITSGVATIRAARTVVLCAFGSAKAAAMRAMAEGPPSAQCPASGLRDHADLRVVLDGAAASGARGAFA